MELLHYLNHRPVPMVRLMSDGGRKMEQSRTVFCFLRLVPQNVSRFMSRIHCFCSVTCSNGTRWTAPLIACPHPPLVVYWPRTFEGSPPPPAPQAPGPPVLEPAAPKKVTTPWATRMWPKGPSQSAWAVTQTAPAVCGAGAGSPRSIAQAQSVWALGSSGRIVYACPDSSVPTLVTP